MHRNAFLLICLLFFLAACQEKKQAPTPAPWGEVLDDSVDSQAGFDLEQIQANGEIIVATLSGPATYYDYHGRHLGLQYMLAQKFAARIGVSLRVDVCRDTAEMKQKLSQGDVDLIIVPLSDKAPGWLVGSDKERLQQELADWYTPSVTEEVKKEESFLLSSRSVKRRVFSPMLSRKDGVISHYDALFVKYCQPIHWDWRLMAAQCYQESTFDPKATSWAGAKGLMQIMPTTADHLGLPRDKMYDPESSIAAAAKYLKELNTHFSEIRDPGERQKFVLAAYNGGSFHIRDAMALAERDGKSKHLWRDVSAYVLKLSDPAYYQDPIVKYGYMRGSETVGYVQKIIERWNSYRGVRTPHVDTSGFQPQKAKRQHKYQI